MRLAPSSVRQSPIAARPTGESPRRIRLRSSWPVAFRSEHAI